MKIGDKIKMPDVITDEMAMESGIPAEYSAIVAGSEGVLTRNESFNRDFICVSFEQIPFLIPKKWFAQGAQKKADHAEGMAKAVFIGPNFEIMVDDWIIAKVSTSAKNKHGLDCGDANARRIVAAWNACDGIETEVLEEMGNGEVCEVLQKNADMDAVWVAQHAVESRLRAENERLREALEKISEALPKIDAIPVAEYNPGYSYRELIAVHKIARAALSNDSLKSDTK